MRSLRKVAQFLPTDQNSIDVFHDGDRLFADPAHHYTRVLLAALPDPANPHANAEEALSGELPSPINPPSGCRFRTRCTRAEEICATTEPLLEQVRDDDHWVACHFPVLPPDA